MVRRNLISKLDDIDKLIELAENIKPVVKEPKTHPEIDEFIEYLKIKSGRKRVPSHIIYFHYYLWQPKRRVSRRTFITYFKTKFKQTKTDHGIGFFLDPRPFDLTPQGFFRSRAFMRKERDEKRKENTKK